MNSVVCTRIYESDKLPFNRAEALRYFGYVKAKSEPSENVAAIFGECVKEAKAACTYKVCYAKFDISRKGETIDLGFTTTNSHSLSRNLEGCEQVIAFAATVGIGIDRLISRYAKTDPVKSYAFQAIGAERIETLCDAFNADVTAAFAKENLFTRPRFSCGYGDFLLEKQTDFFIALDCPRKIGVTLNESLLMSPSKSVTAIIGAGRSVCRNESHKCASCYDRENCQFRK